MNSKMKKAAVIAAIVIAAVVQVHAEEWIVKVQETRQAAGQAAEQETGKQEPEIVFVQVGESNGEADTAGWTAQGTGIIAETVSCTAGFDGDGFNGVEESPVYYNIPLTNEQQDIVRKIAEEYGVPFDLVLAAMQVESNFDITAVGNGNCYGIMQIHKINHPALEKQLGITDWLSLSDNTRAGCYMLGNLLDKYQDETRALMAYNMGEGAAKKAWNAGTRSTGYTQKVQSAKQSLTGQVNEKAAG